MSQFSIWTLGFGYWVLFGIWQLGFGILLWCFCSCDGGDGASDGGGSGEVNRIVSLAPSLTEILFAIGAGERVVGVTSLCDYPPEARNKAIIGDVNVNIEKILVLKPDLIVADASLNRASIDILKGRAFRVAVFESGRIDDVPTTVARLGDILRCRERADAVVAELRGAIKAVEAKSGARKERRRTVIFEVCALPIFVAGPGSHIDDALKICGAENGGKDLPANWSNLNWESYLARDPDVVILCHNLRDQAEKRAGWANLKAVKNNCVVEIDPDIFSRPSLRCVMNIDRLATAIYGGD